MWGGHILYLQRSAVDRSIWKIRQRSRRPAKRGVDLSVCRDPILGYLLVYVDDILVLSKTLCPECVKKVVADIYSKVLHIITSPLHFNVLFCIEILERIIIPVLPFS